MMGHMILLNITFTFTQLQDALNNLKCIQGKHFRKKKKTMTLVFASAMLFQFYIYIYPQQWSTDIQIYNTNIHSQPNPPHTLTFLQL